MARSFLQGTSDTTDLTTYTFASQNLGTAAADRYIVVCVQGRRASGTPTATLTVGGVSATQVVVSPSSSAGNFVGIYIAAVPTGSTGSVVVTFDAGMLRCGIQVYRLDNLVSATANDTQNSTANPPAVTLTVPTNGTGIGAAVATGGAAVSTTWAGLTEDYDSYVESSMCVTSASGDFPAGSSLSTSATFAGSPTARGGVWASWQFNAAASFNPGWATGATKIIGSAF